MQTMFLLQNKNSVLHTFCLNFSSQIRAGQSYILTLPQANSMFIPVLDAEKEPQDGKTDALLRMTTSQWLLKPLYIEGAPVSFVTSQTGGLWCCCCTSEPSKRACFPSQYPVPMTSRHLEASAVVPIGLFLNLYSLFWEPPEGEETNFLLPHCHHHFFWKFNHF